MQGLKQWSWIASLALVGCNAVLGLDPRSLDLADSGAKPAGSHPTGTPDATTDVDSSALSPGGDAKGDATAEASVADATSDGSSSEAGDAMSESAPPPPFCKTNPNGTPCGSGSSQVCNGGQCVPCNAGGSCDDPSMPCVHSTYSCASGTAQCEQVSFVTDGNSCGGSNYCFGGVCGPCQMNVACAPAANPCHVGKVTSCAGGNATCTDQGSNASAGTSCQTGSVTGVCDGAGSCAACTVNAQCLLNSGCQTGITTCSTGPQCTSPSNENEGQPCGAPGNICHAGACGACNVATCANGCCASNGCVTARTTSVCGPNGGACAACLPPQATPACGASGCTISSCTTGYADCNGNPGDGCEIPITTSTDCGRCGHDCGGGACSNGACQPQTLVSGIDTPNGMDVDANGIYFTVDGMVDGCPLSGCASGVASIGVFGNAGPIVAVNGSVAFFSSPGGTTYPSLYICPTTGCPTSVMPVMQPGGGVLAGGATLLAYAGNLDMLVAFKGPPLIWRCVGVSGTTCSSLVKGGSNPYPSPPIADDGTDLYFTVTEDGGTNLVKCPLGTTCDASTLTTVISGFQGTLLALYQGQLYTTGGGYRVVYTCPLSNCSSLTAMNGGFYSAQGLAVDQDGVYFTSGKATSTTPGVYTCPLTGCGTQNAHPMANNVSSPGVIKTEGQFVYWVNQGEPGDGSPAFVPGTASIMRVAK